MSKIKKFKDFINESIEYIDDEYSDDYEELMNIKELIDDVYSARNDLENALTALNKGVKGYGIGDYISFTEIENITKDVENLESDIDNEIAEIDRKRERKASRDEDIERINEEIDELFKKALGNNQQLIDNFRKWIDRAFIDFETTPVEEMDEYDCYGEIDAYLDDTTYAETLNNVLDIMGNKTSGGSAVIEEKVNELIRTYWQLKYDLENDDEDEDDDY